MARKRMIDPEFWSDEEIGKWSFQSRLFYIGLWNFADDKGRFKAHSALLGAQIFPYDRKIDIERLKKEIKHKILWYEVEGLQYGWIRNFLRYQKIDHPSDSKLPEASPNSQVRVPPNISKVNISKDNINKDRASQQVVNSNQKLLDTVYKEGLNIYALINKLKKQFGWAKEYEIPCEVIDKVCNTYLARKDKIENDWAWFLTAFKQASAQYFANKEIAKSAEYKKGGLSLKEIMERAK